MYATDHTPPEKRRAGVRAGVAIALVDERGAIHYVQPWLNQNPEAGGYP
jgi:hypothetical protein